MVDHFARLRREGFVYADHAAMTQLPDFIVSKANEDFSWPRANAWRGLYGWAEQETERLEEARRRILQAAGLRGYVARFNRGVTSALNGVARALAAEESELIVVCSPLEHQANLLSWQNIAREVRVLGWGERGVDLEQATGVMRGARVLAMTAASNVTGESLPMRELVEMAHSMGMKVVIDAAQFTAHAALPADGWGADIIVTSGHKMYGPVSLGVTFMSESVQAVGPSVWGGGMGEADGWEAGTWSAYEARMLAWAWEFVTVGVDEGAWRAVEVVNKWAGERTIRPRGLQVGPLVSYVPSGHPHDVAAKLGELGVMVRAGQLCAPQAMQAYGVRETGVVRFSFGAMTNEADCEQLAEVLESNQDLL